MKLDTTTKIVGLVSTIVGIMISIAVYVGGRKIQALEANLKNLDAVDKQMDVSKKAYDLSSRLMLEFQLPMARAFAQLYSENGVASKIPILIPTTELVQEFEKTIPQWKGRSHLMTGDARTAEGLKARQVVTLVIRNIGYSEASNIKLKALQKKSPHRDPLVGWQEFTDNSKSVVIPYYEIPSKKVKWDTVTVTLADLVGLDGKDAEGEKAQVVLASVSGSNVMYGTVLIPIEISWTDSMNGEVKRKAIMESQLSQLRSTLLGAEIGRSRSASLD